MIDTVVVKFPIEPTDANLQYGWQASCHVDLTTGEVRTKYMRNVDPIKGTFYPLGYRDEPVLLLEFSLPKMYYRQNWPMLADMAAAIAEVDALIAQDRGWPELPSVADGEVVRLDACYNYSVGDDIHAYLQALSRLEYRSRQTVPFCGTGVEYRSAATKTKVYNKRLECGTFHRNRPDLWAPPGTLRHETTIRHGKDVAQALRLTRPVTLREVEPEAVLDILWRDLQHLGIANCEFATRDVALDRLCDQFGPNKGLRLYGALCAYQDRGKRRVARETHTQRHSIMRLLREARAAGIAPAMMEEKTLPPLDIKWPPTPEEVLAGFWHATEEYEYRKGEQRDY